MIWFIPIFACLIASGLAKEREDCLIQCGTEHNDCFTQTVMDGQTAWDKCDYNYNKVCLRKCDGLEVKETFKQYSCTLECYKNGPVCFTTYTDISEMGECERKIYNCIRTCHDDQPLITAEKYKSALSLCEAKLQDCHKNIEDNDSGFSCNDQFKKCMKDSLNIINYS